MKTILLSCVTIILLAGCSNEAGPSGPAANPYAGTWSVAFAGSLAGSRLVTIASNGTFSFNASVSGYSGPFTYTGSVSYTGNVSADIYYGGSVVGSLSGMLTGNSGSGTYQTSAGNGTWTATKQ